MANTLALLVLTFTNLPLMAQWLDYKEVGVPRTKDGKVDLSAPAPRVASGKPDLSGVWMVEPTTRDENQKLYGNLKAIETFDVPGNELAMLSKYMINILADFKRDEEPLRPEAAKLLRERAANPGKGPPSTHCLPGGVPWATFVAPFKMIQASREAVCAENEKDFAHMVK